VLGRHRAAHDRQRDVLVDGNQCTDDVCTSGVPSNPALPVNTPCDQTGGHLCNGDPDTPACVECNVASDCPTQPQDDECKTTTCTDGACGMSFTDIHTAIAAQTAGDCQKVGVRWHGRHAIGPGRQRCSAPRQRMHDRRVLWRDHHPRAGRAGRALRANGVCDGNGQCVGCNAPSDCGATSFCRPSWTCDAGTCNPVDAANNTPLPANQQTAGDCQQLQCNGSGGVKSVADNTDLPADDGIQCTGETCVGGSPQHPARALNYACTDNGGLYCDGAGACVQCNDAIQCPDPGQTCKIAACTDHVCGAGNASYGTPAPDGLQTTGDCHLVVCDGSGGTTSIIQNGDVPADDGNQCTGETCNAGNPLPPGPCCGRGLQPERRHGVRRRRQLRHL